MVHGSFAFFAYCFPFHYALARVSNVTFLGTPTTYRAVTIAWQGVLVPSLMVIVSQVDILARPGPVALSREFLCK
jgi:hypothetical protein